MSTKTKHHERSFVAIKPDGVQRGLVGEILTRFEKKGLKIVAMKMIWPTTEFSIVSRSEGGAGIHFPHTPFSSRPARADFVSARRLRVAGG